MEIVILKGIRTGIDYAHLFRLSKADLVCLIVALKPHLAGSLFKCSKRDLIGELRNILE